MHCSKDRSWKLYDNKLRNEKLDLIKYRGIKRKSPVYHSVFVQILQG